MRGSTRLVGVVIFLDTPDGNPRLSQNIGMGIYFLTGLEAEQGIGARRLRCIFRATPDYDQKPKSLKGTDVSTRLLVD